jgi:hypothetical protein
MKLSYLLVITLRLRSRGRQSHDIDELRRRAWMGSLMSKDESTEERGAREKFGAWLREVEAAAAELVELGDALFRGGERSDPALLRRYRL